MSGLADARAALARLRGDRPAAGAVRLEVADGVARVVLDHPAARGAVSLSMMVGLADAAADLAGFDGGLVVLASTDPRAFCSGGYLPELLDALDGPEGALAMSRAMSTVLDALAALPAVVVAALDGPALGGGAELALAADLRVAADGARLHFVQARLGIAPGWGGARRLAARIGPSAALAVLAGADPLDADRCAALGLVDHRVPADAADAARAWLDRPPEVLRALKRQLARPDEESPAFAALWGRDAHRRALAARRP